MLEFFQTYLYLTGCAMLAVPFLILFYYKKENRHAMIFMGILCGLTAFFFSPYSVRDYWHPMFVFPNIPIEDFLYGFFFGGFLSECADIFLKHKFKKTKGRKWLLVVGFFFFISSYLFIVSFLRFNTIWFLLFFGFFVGMANMYLNKKVFKFQIVSGLFGVFLAFLGFKVLLLIDPSFVHNSWKLKNLTGILLSGIPLEEFLFAFVLGFSVTHLYEMLKGWKIT